MVEADISKVVREALSEVGHDGWKVLPVQKNEKSDQGVDQQKQQF